MDFNDKQALRELSMDIDSFYNCKSYILASRKLPVNAYYKPRNRYRADSLLRYLNRTLLDSYDIVIGVTSNDISATVGPHKDWGVFGFGYCPGHACVISNYRLRKNADPEQVNTRLKNVALHEIGHNFGLYHCGDMACLMKDAKGKLSNVEGKGRKFCKRCHDRIFN